MYDILELSKKLLPELKEIAKELNIKKAETLKKQDLIYKILDQQAIEATELKPAVAAENRQIQSSLEQINQENESLLRRGKRPRTLKPVIKRPTESVMSVSPDDLKKPEGMTSVWDERARKKVKPEEKPDLFKSAEPISEEGKTPKWRQDQRPDQRTDQKGTKKERFEKNLPDSTDWGKMETTVVFSNFPANHEFEEKSAILGTWGAGHRKVEVTVSQRQKRLL